MHQRIFFVKLYFLNSRLPKGFGTRADIMNLVKDSQFINESLPDDKMSSIISGALDRLH